MFGSATTNKQENYETNFQTNSFVSLSQPTWSGWSERNSHSPRYGHYVSLLREVCRSTPRVNQHWIASNPNPRIGSAYPDRGTALSFIGGLIWRGAFLVMNWLKLVFRPTCSAFINNTHPPARYRRDTQWQDFVVVDNFRAKPEWTRAMRVRVPLGVRRRAVSTWGRGIGWCGCENMRPRRFGADCWRYLWSQL